MLYQKTTHLTTLLFFLSTLSFTQVNYNAHTVAPSFSGAFRVGFNFGDDYAWGDFTDEQLATLASNVGATAARPTLPETFTGFWGYSVRVDAFNHYKNNLGMADLTCMVGFPSSAKRETTTYPCGSNPSVQSELFANLYEPIWDNNNGTPINENNYYATYLYNVVNTYKNYVTFWEIWNEVGFDYTYWKGWQKRGVAGNWWENNPDPCDYKLRAPIFHYIRMLRISYDIVKTLDPTGLVCPSSPGYPSFLDAILRNTDNPVDGSVTPQYPHKGGAYFDAIAHHAYPHFDGSVRRRDPTDQFWQYFRHSDGAAEGIGLVINNFENVFKTHSYDGGTYPQKKWLITEMNIPRIAFNPNQWGADYDCGGAELQRNFIPKAYVACVKNGIMQWNVWQLGERHFSPAREEFDVMGLYQYLSNPATAVVNDEGWSLKTTSGQLFNKTYDATRTAELNLPTNTDGAAFKDASGNYTYILWAKTTTDKSEMATATYSFPPQLGFSQMTKREWNFSNANTTTSVSANNIALTGAPIFLTPSVIIPVELVHFKGEVQKDKNLLTWKTATERNTAYFEVEKSYDGHIWRKIDQVKAVGESQTPQYYSYADDNKMQTIGTVYYYRLHIVDNDGSERFSNIIALKVVANMTATVFPNPFDKTLTISIQSSFQDNVMVSVTDVSGRVFYENKMSVDVSKAIELSTENFSNGLFFVKIVGKNEIILKKVIKS
ncbi:MAG: T9SS type A sorting domain-containing protein [Saprospiraceae bacterium]|nr:T9SS type A sorting domain-containing protein [Saprospiraceae bacterium]